VEVWCRGVGKGVGELKICHQLQGGSQTKFTCWKQTYKSIQPTRVAHVASVQNESPSSSRSVTIFDEEFGRYQMFQQFQTTQMMLSFSTATLA